MKNHMKKKLLEGKVVLGTFVSLGHPDITECLSRVGFDFLILDAEHGPADFQTLQVMMQSMNGTTCIPIVRPQWNDMAVIKRVLDIGAYGVLIPWVNSKEEAENAVRYCKYAPDGVRGWGPRRAGMFDQDYFKTANNENFVSVQIETQEALDNLDEILSVPGIDACYIGPFDLSVNLGFGIPPNWNDLQYLAAFDRVLEASARHRKPAGMYCLSEKVRWAIDKGFMFNTIDSADKFLLSAARTALETGRSAMKQGKA